MENGTQLILDEFMPEISQRQTVGASASHARTSVSQENNSALRETAQACFSELCTFLDKSQKKKDPNGYSLRMLRTCFLLMGDGTSPDFSLNWMRGGYDAEWEIINSKDFVPQNRERIFVIGHNRRFGRREILPLERPDGENTNRVMQIGRRPSATRDNLNQYRVYDTKGLAPTLNKMDGGGREPMIISAAYSRLEGGQSLQGLRTNSERKRLQRTVDGGGI